MASILTCAVTSMTWCFCTAAASLLGSCCGNDKPGTEAPGPTSGRRRSVFVLFLSIALQLGFQFGLAKYFVESNLSTFVHTNWLDGCEQLEGDEDLERSCVGNNGNYRVSAATTLFFILAAVAAFFKPTANREAWPAKIVIYLFLVGATVLIPSDPLFSDIYLNIARVGGILFILVQQLIIVDVAYNWNNSWVEKSNQAERDEAGSGKKWLMAILISCAILFGGAIAVLIYMFIDYTGCTANNAFIAFTLIFCIALTAAQMTGDEGSLLSSSCISAWACFLCYTAVSKNPDESCNPRYGEPSRLSIAFGLAVTMISLLWTGWSYTAEDKLSYKHDNAAASSAYEEAKDGGEKKPVTGIVTGDVPEDSKDEEAPDKDEVASSRLSNSWRLNIALAAVACWSAMTLTHWGEIQSNGTVANSSVGRVSMWMIIGSQWLVMMLYVWTLVAPRLFPDRDFS